MSILTAAPARLAPSAPTAPALPLYRLSVEQYHAMAEHGILTTNDRVELIHGLLVAKMTKHVPHPLANGLVLDALVPICPSGWCLRVLDPITLTASEPEPDLVIARGTRRVYSNRHPGPAEVGLVVEVADASLAYDRNVKKPMYAGERIPVYWIVNLVDNTLEVYTDPSGPSPQPDYATCRILAPTDEVPVFLDGQEVGRIAVRELLP